MTDCRFFEWEKLSVEGKKVIFGEALQKLLA